MEGSQGKPETVAGTPLYPHLGAGPGEGRTAELAATLLWGVVAAAAAGIAWASGFHAPAMTGNLVAHM